MDRTGYLFALRGVVAILIANVIFSASCEAKAPSGTAGKLFSRGSSAPFEDSYVEPASCCDCGDEICDSSCIDCGDSVDCSPCKPSARVYGGFEATFVQPRFEQNVAFTTMQGDGGTFESFTDTEFDYDLEFAPRAWVGLDFSDGLGWRATWWQFNHDPSAISANPPANGFGSITHPSFGNVDISSVIPTDTFYAASELEAYTIDLEAVKRTNFCSWDFAVGGGVRYARVEQGYAAQLRDTNDVLRGQIDYSQSIEGVGPTVSVAAYRSMTASTGFFCNARGSVLFGDGESQLNAGEDLDLQNPFTTTRVTNRDDLLSIGDLQVGFRWQSRSNRLHRPFLSVAFEGQIWNGAGSATSEDGALGFYGITSGAGVDW